MNQKDLEVMIEQDLLRMLLMLGMHINAEKIPISILRGLGHILVALPENRPPGGLGTQFLAEIKAEAATLAAEHLRNCPDCAADISPQPSTQVN